MKAMNMEIKDFYKKYNLSRCTFAHIAGVGAESLIKFENCASHSRYFSDELDAQFF